MRGASTGSAINRTRRSGESAVFMQIRHRWNNIAPFAAKLYRVVPVTRRGFLFKTTSQPHHLRIIWINCLSVCACGTQGQASRNISFRHVAAYSVRIRSKFNKDVCSEPQIGNSPTYVSFVSTVLFKISSKFRLPR